MCGSTCMESQWDKVRGIQVQSQLAQSLGYLDESYLENISKHRR